MQVFEDVVEILDPEMNIDSETGDDEIQVTLKWSQWVSTFKASLITNLKSGENVSDFEFKFVWEFKSICWASTLLAGNQPSLFGCGKTMQGMKHERHDWVELREGWWAPCTPDLTMLNRGPRDD